MAAATHDDSREDSRQRSAEKAGETKPSRLIKAAATRKRQKVAMLANAITRIATTSAW